MKLFTNETKRKLSYNAIPLIHIYFQSLISSQHPNFKDANLDSISYRDRSSVSALIYIRKLSLRWPPKSYTAFASDIKRWIQEIDTIISD